jgi:hypothetical protein
VDTLVGVSFVFWYVVRPSLALRACLCKLRFWCLVLVLSLPPVAAAPLPGGVSRGLRCDGFGGFM